MTFLRMMLIAAVTAVASLASAAAQSLTTQDVERFLATSAELEPFRARYPDIDIDMRGVDPTNLGSFLGEDGRIELFQRATAQLPAGEARSALSGIVRRHGFSDIQSFAAVGDAILITALALELEKEDMSQLDDITPEMLAQLPPQMQVRMADMRRMMAAVQSVSQQDRDTLRPLKARIEAEGLR